MVNSVQLSFLLGLVSILIMEKICGRDPWIKFLFQPWLYFPYFRCEDTD